MSQMLKGLEKTCSLIIADKVDRNFLVCGVTVSITKLREVQGDEFGKQSSKLHRLFGENIYNQ